MIICSTISYILEGLSFMPSCLYGTLTMQVSSIVVKLRKEVSRTFILSNNHIPSQTCWDLAVKRALQIINISSSPLIKVFNRQYAKPLLAFWPVIVLIGKHTCIAYSSMLKNTIRVGTFSSFYCNGLPYIALFHLCPFYFVITVLVGFWWN